MIQFTCDAAVDNDEFGTHNELRCLSAARGERLCEEFTMWISQQPRSLPSVFAPAYGDGDCSQRNRQHKASVLSLSPTFTSALTPEQRTPSTGVLANARPSLDVSAPEPFTVLGLMIYQSNFLVDDSL